MACRRRIRALHGQHYGERKDGGEDDCLGSLEPVRLGAGEYFTCYLNCRTRMWKPSFFGAKWNVNQWLDDGKNGVIVNGILLAAKALPNRPHRYRTQAHPQPVV